MVDEKKILEEYNNRRTEVTSGTSNMTVAGVANLVKGGTVMISPDFQRRDRWDDKRRSRLIESFLVNIPVPAVYLNSEEDGPYSVIDGKQRLTAIHKFINEGMPLTDLEFLTELEGVTYADLPAKIRSKLEVESALIAVTVTSHNLEEAVDSEVKYRVFHRLNTGGVELEPQEIRNAIFRGTLNDLLVELSNNEFIQKQLKVMPGTRSFEKMKDHECVLRFLCMVELWESGIDDDIKTLMDNFMSANRSAPDEDIREWRKDFNVMSERVQALFGEAAFRNWNYASQTWRDMQNLALYDAQAVSVSLLSEEQFEESLASKDDIISDLIDLFEEDEYFNESIGRGTGSQAKVEYRINALLSVLLRENVER